MLPARGLEEEFISNLAIIVRLARGVRLYKCTGCRRQILSAQSFV